MKTLNDTVRANRLDVFRHTLRSIALASAARLVEGGPHRSGMLQHRSSRVPRAYDS